MRAISDSDRQGYRELFSVHPFRALFVSRSLLIVTETMKALALSLLVFERTGSPLLAVGAYMGGILAYLVGGMLLLSVADAFSAQLIITGTHLFRFAVICLLPLSVLPVPIILVLAVATGVFGPVAEGSAASSLTTMLDGRDYVSGRALFTASAGAAQIVGHGAAGLLLVTLSPGGVLIIAAVVCLVAAGGSWVGLRNAGVGSRRRGLPGTGGPDVPSPLSRFRLSAPRATWGVNKALLVDQRVRGLLLAQLVPCSLAVSAEGAVIAYTAGMGRSSAGLMFTAITTGMLAGNLLVGRLAGARAERLVLPLVLMTGCMMTVFALRPGLALAVAFIGISSAGLGYGVGLQARFLKALPEHARGQAFGLLSTGMLTGQALTIFAAGALTAAFDAGPVIAAFGVLVIVSGLVLAPYLRRTDPEPLHPAGHPSDQPIERELDMTFIRTEPNCEEPPTTDRKKYWQ